jgi:twitching motility protein PilT
MNYEQLLRFTVEQNASDVHLQAGALPMLRIQGTLRGVDGPPIAAEELRTFLDSIAPADIAQDLNKAAIEGAVFVHAIPEVARFRCQLFSHMQSPGVSVRVIPPAPPPLETLHLPAVLRDIALARHGLVMITGEAGSGRTTAMASMVDQINQALTCQIITIENPVEFVYPARKALVSHRAVGVDTPSFAGGLTQALRKDPDVLVLGAVPDAATARLVLQAAEARLKVFAVIDCSGAILAIERILGMVPPDERGTAKQQLAAALEAVIGLRLAVTREGKRRAAVEILRSGPMVSGSITEGRLADLFHFVEGRQGGMQSFDQHLLALHQAGLISGTEAMRRSTNPEAVASQLRAAKPSAPKADAAAAGPAPLA